MKFDNYKLNLSSEEKKELGFRYDSNLEVYVYEFPVYKSNKKVSLICKLYINNETGKVLINVYDINGNLYSSFYNRNYGKSKIVSIVDNNISKKINEIEKKIEGDNQYE